MFVLPIITFFLFAIVYFSKKKNAIESVVVSWLFVTLYSWIIMELFSMFELINTITAVLSWCVICIVLAIIVVKDKSVRIAMEYIKNSRRIRDYWKQHRMAFICVGVFCVIICILSLLRSQNLFDNIHHRLSKIMHWIQDGKVGYFATWTTTEIKYSNLTEYMMAQIYLLKGSDRLITIVQAGAYICSGCCIYGISRKIGASVRFALLAVWIFFLTPMVIIETITTQTDVVAGLYLLSFIYFLLDYIHADKLCMNKESALSAVCLSASVLFGYLSKPTVCFAMIIFFVWMCVVRLIKRDKFAVLLQYILIGIVVTVILLLPDAYRNYEYKNAPIPVYAENREVTSVTNRGLNDTNNSMVSSEANNALASLTNPKKFAAVCIRNLAANSTSRCFPKINNLLVRFVEKFEFVIDFSMNLGFHVLVTEGLGETNEPSPVIMFLLIVSWLCVLMRISKIKRESVLYFLLATLSLIVQAGLMGYTFFRQRYLIGIMATLCPAFAVVMENIRISMKMRLNIAVAVITICSFGMVNALSYEIPYIMFGFQGENIHQYFFYEDDEELYYQLLLDHINKNGYQTVGMYGSIAYEYVLWREIENLERMEHVNVKSSYQGAKLEDMEFMPECIIEEVSVEEGTNWEEIMYCHGQKYVCEWKVIGENGRNYAVLVPCEQ